MGSRFSLVQSLSRGQLFVTLWTAAHQASYPSPAPGACSNSCPWSLMPSNHLILCHPFFSLPSIFPSIRVFSSESLLHSTWPKYWSFSFTICPSSEYSGLISFRIDWFDLLAVQGTPKSLLQLCSSKASALQRSAFCMVQLSYVYMTTGKTIALTIWTFVSKEMSPLFNVLSRFVIALPFKKQPSFNFHGCSHCPQWFCRPTK